MSGEGKVSARPLKVRVLLLLLLAVTTAGMAPTSASAVVVIENNFTGSGTLKLGMDFFTDDFVKCTSAVIRGTVPYPPDGTASITEWSPGNCSVYRQNQNIGTATVNILTLPEVEAVSTSRLYFGQFTARATFQINGSTCDPEFTIGASNPDYSSGLTSNTIDGSFPDTSFIDWNPGQPCDFSGGDLSRATFSFADPQFELTERPVLPSMYELRNSNSGGATDAAFNLPLQQASDLPIAGDWDGDGYHTVGFFRPSNATFYLSNTNSNINAIFQFGSSGDLPVVGDWNSDGTDTVGVRRPSTGWFYLRDSNSAGAAQYSFAFGNSEDLPIAGDWNNNGEDTIGVYRPSTSFFYLNNVNATASPDHSFAYGNHGGGDLPLAGDWDENGYDSVGLYRQSTGEWFLDNEVPANQPVSYVFTYGALGYTFPIVGDWNNSGTDTPGAVLP